MTYIWLLLILPGLICGYFIFLRPVLAAVPKFKQFYTEADGFWMKVSALGGHSASIAWGYFLALIGILFDWIEPIAAALGDPDIKNQITSTLQADPQVLGYIAMGISAITIAARLRSIGKE